MPSFCTLQSSLDTEPLPSLDTKPLPLLDTEPLPSLATELLPSLDTEPLPSLVTEPLPLLDTELLPSPDENRSQSKGATYKQNSRAVKKIDDILSRLQLKTRTVTVDHMSSSDEKSVKSPTKEKSNTKRKEKEKPTATIEMHENLKNTINKIDNEMIDFAKKYEQEQELINVKITDIIEKLIAPLKLENEKLQKDESLIYLLKYTYHLHK